MAELDILNVLTRDFIDVKAVEKTLKYYSVRNFRSLYDIQRSIVSVRRFDVHMNDLVRITRLSTEIVKSHYPHRYGYYIPGNVIPNESKKKCKELGLFGKPLAQDVVSMYRDSISANILMFVDGEFIDTCEFVIDDDHLTAILDVDAGTDAKDSMRDGIPYEKYVEYKENNSLVTIFVVPNYYYSTSEFNCPTLKEILRYNVPSDRFTTVDHFDSNKTLFFMNNDSGNKSIMHGMKCTVDEDKTVHLPTDAEYSTLKLKISALTLGNVHEIKVFEPGEDTWFMTDDENYNTPLPIENIITFVERDGVLRFDNSITVDLYYPNIYHLNNVQPEDKVYAYILYTDTVDSEYENDLALLKLLSGDLLNRYKIDSLPEFVKTYMPLDITWFDGSEYTDCMYYPDRVLYNIDALAQYVLHDKNILLKYLIYRLDHCPRYYINVAKLSLDGRVRTDTYNECDVEGDIVFFDEPNYVFSLRRRYIPNTYFGSDFRIFIDGKFLSPKLYEFITTMDYYHFYIPTKYIKEDSVIELERYLEYRFNVSNIIMDVNSPVQYDIPKSIPRIYTYDIAVIDETSNMYLDTNKYNIIAYSDILKKEITLEHWQYSVIKDYFKIELLDESLKGHSIKAVIDHTLTTRTFDVDVDNYDFPLTVTVPNYKFINTKEIRTFLGDLLIPEEALSIDNNGKYLRDAEITFYFDMDAVTATDSNIITVDELPTSIKCEYRLDYIENEYGFIDTGDSLSLPLDLKWYDIYVNGVKLHKYNVDIITSSKFFIKGVDSRKNLRIYCRGDIYDEFNYIHSESVENKLFDSIEDIYLELLKDRDVIQDTANSITDGLMLELGRINQFVHDVLQYIFINPNTQQIDEEIQETYADLIDEWGILWLKTNDDPDAIMKIAINSNRRSDIMKKGQYRYGFTPLWLGNHDDARDGEYLCDPVTGDPGMKDADGTVISTGILNRLNSHKERFYDVLSGFNRQYMDIYHIEPTENTHASVVKANDNLIEEAITEVPDGTKTFMISIDMDVLEKGLMNVMQHSSYMPNIKITYKTIGSDDAKMTITSLDTTNHSNLIMTTDAITSIDSITLLPSTGEDASSMDELKCVLHSVLIAF